MWPKSACVRKMEGLKCFFPFQEHYLLSSLSTQESWSTFYTSFKSISSKINTFEFSCSKRLCSVSNNVSYNITRFMTPELCHTLLEVFTVQRVVVQDLERWDNLTVWRYFHSQLFMKKLEKGHMSRGDHSRGAQSTPRAQKAAGYLFPADIWQQSTCTSRHLHCKMNNRHINHLKSQLFTWQCNKE